MKLLNSLLLPIITIITIGSCSQSDHNHSSDIQIKNTTDRFKDQGLEGVESVLFDAEKKVLYLTNGQDYVPGTDGFISKASPDGKNLELKWVKDLNRPTGMALKDNKLYVADLNRLLVIGTQLGSIIETYQEPIPGSALNDVTIDSKGNVYVSASRLGAIFKLTDGQLKPWVQDNMQLKYANGLLVESDNLLVGGFNLSRVALGTNQINNLMTHPSIKDFEGIVSDGQNGYFATTAGTSSLFYIDETLHADPVLVSRDYMGDLSYDDKSKTIYIPRGNDDTGEYYISVVGLE